MKNPVLASIALHLTVLIILLADIPLWYSAPKKDRIVPAPIIVDISKVDIAPVTNLPAKKEVVKKKVEEQKEKQVKKKVSKVETVKKPVLVPPPALPKTEPKKVNKDGVTAVKEKKPQPKDVPVVKPAEKVEPSKQVKNKPIQEDEEMKSLLASLEKLEKEEAAIKAERQKQKTQTKEKEEVTKGVKGGGAGDYRKELTISEQDALSSRLSACWNIDAGVKGAVDMVVEIRVNLRKDGSVDDVKIADRARYNTDSSFRSVAESARRAVYICEYNKEDSPFKFLAVKYPQNFEVWKTLVLFFNPLDGGVK